MIDALLNQLCTINRKTSTKGTRAQISNAYSSVASSVPCRIEQLSQTSPSFVLQSTGFRSGNDFIGFFLSNVDIQIGDQIIRSGDLLTLYVRFPHAVYDGVGIHHYEVSFGLQEI